MLDIRLSSLWLALVTGCLQARNRYRKSFYKATCARSSMDRASVFGTEGWGFESLRAYS